MTNKTFAFSFVLDQSDPNYETYADQANDFGDGQQIHYYVLKAEDLKQEEKTTLYVDYQHLVSFAWEDPSFMDSLMSHYARYEPYLKKALTQFLADNGHAIVQQRWFQVGIYNMPQINKIRDLKTLSLGKIMSIQGTVTRTTEVKPELQLGSFKCLQCQQACPAIEQQFKYTQPVRCDSDRC